MKQNIEKEIKNSLKIQPEDTVDRRRGPDIWFKLIRWAGTTAWAIFILMIFMLDKAKPQIETFFDRWLHVTLRNRWDKLFLKDVFFLH